MENQNLSNEDGYISPEIAMQRYAGALRQTAARPTKFDPRGASATMPREKSVPPQNIPMQGSHRFLKMKGQDPTQFDRLCDLSLLNERDEAQMFPSLRRNITRLIPTTPATQEAEPDLWHSRNPSTIAEGKLPAERIFLGADSLPRQLMSRLNPSDTRILAAETEQLTEPFVRVEGTSERYRFFPAAEELPLSGLWHDPVPFSDAGKQDTFLKIRPKKAEDLAKKSAEPFPPDPSGLPMMAPKSLSLSEQQLKTAPRASMQYAADDIAVYPGNIPMDNIVDLQEKALFKSFEKLSQDAVVENLLLNAVRPGFRHGVIQQLQQPTEKQWKEQNAQKGRERAAAGAPKVKGASALTQSSGKEKAASAAGKKKVTFDLSDSRSKVLKIDDSDNSESDDAPAKLIQQLQMMQRNIQAEQKARKEVRSEPPASDEVLESNNEVSGERSVQELITRCSLKLKALKGTKGRTSAEPPPWNSVAAPEGMKRPSRLLRDIEAMEAREADLNYDYREPGTNPRNDATTLLLPQPTEESISLTCSKGLQGLRALRGRPRVRSPRSMPKAELVCLSRSLLPNCPGWEEDALASVEEAPESLLTKETENSQQPSYEIYHDTPTPPEHLIDSTPTFEELEQQFLPTTGYPHDSKRSNYPAAIPQFVSRLSSTQSSRMAVPPAAAVMYALPKESGGPPFVEAMPTDPRSGASQTTETALAKLSAEEMRNIEELVAGGFVALQRQARRVDYRHKWEEEKVRLKMIINEPIHARDPEFLERQEQLLSKWQYPSKEISPGYYIKEANLEEERLSILASKKRRSIFDLQKALNEMKEQEEEALRRRQLEEEQEKETRIRESIYVPSEKVAPPGQTPKDVKEPEEEEKADPSSDEAKEEEKSPEPALTAEQQQAIERLKNEYRQLKKQPQSEEIAKEMKRIKREIAEIMGRKRKKRLKQVRRKSPPPSPQADVESTSFKTDEQLEDEKRKERIRKRLQMQKGGAGALLAKVMEGRGVEEAPEDEEEPAQEEEEEPEEQAQASESSEETVSSISVSSYESVEVPVFAKSVYSSLEHKPVPERVEAWRKLPVDYCGRLLLEQTTDEVQIAPEKRGAKSSINDMLRMFLLVEVRGPALLIYVSPTPKLKKARFSLGSLCGCKQANELSGPGVSEWEYLCSVVVDNTAELEWTNMGSGTEHSYRAIHICARIVYEEEKSSSSENGPSEVRLTEGQRALRTKAYLKGCLTADTDAETQEWMEVLNGRKAFCRYVTACEAFAHKPSEAVATSLWCPGPREIVLEGVPFHPTIDKSIFSTINLPSLDAVYCGWRGMTDSSLTDWMQEIKGKVRTLDLSANEISFRALEQVKSLCEHLSVSQLSLAENRICGDSDAAKLIAYFVENPEPIYLDLRRTAINDEDCKAIASALRNVEKTSLVPKVVNLGENDITEKGLKDIAVAVADKLPRLKALCFPKIPAVGEDKLEAIRQEAPQVRHSQISFKYPICPFPALNEAELPENWLKMPAVISGRLFVEGSTVEGGNGNFNQTNGNGNSLAFFELRGPALFRYTAKTRSEGHSESRGGRVSPQPMGKLEGVLGKDLTGIFVSTVKLSDEKLILTGKGIAAKSRVSQIFQTETWELRGESVDYVREWYRVITIRQAGVACSTIARNVSEGLHPGVGQYCTSCFRRSLELGGRSLPLGQLTRLFAAAGQDFRLRRVDMTNMSLESELLEQLPSTTFAAIELDLLDLSFNNIMPRTSSEALAKFCSSAKKCSLLVLDKNPLGDDESAALFVVRILERPVSRVSLNSCGLGDTFAKAVSQMLIREDKQLPFVTSLELQSNAISAGAMKDMLDVLLPRCPSLKQLSLYGNGFESLDRLRRPIQISFTKTHLDAPRIGLPFDRRLTKKAKEPKPFKPKRYDELDEQARLEADRIAHIKAMSFLKSKAKAGGGARIAAIPAAVKDTPSVPTARNYGLQDNIPRRPKGAKEGKDPPSAKTAMEGKDPPSAKTAMEGKAPSPAKTAKQGKSPPPFAKEGQAPPFAKTAKQENSSPPFPKEGKPPPLAKTAKKGKSPPPFAKEGKPLPFAETAKPGKAPPPFAKKAKEGKDPSFSKKAKEGKASS